MSNKKTLEVQYYINIYFCGTSAGYRLSLTPRLCTGNAFFNFGSFGKHFDEFIAQQVKTGRYATASEAFRDGLRLLEEREIKFNALRRALKEGEESGFADYSLSELIRELDNEGPK